MRPLRNPRSHLAASNGRYNFTRNDPFDRAEAIQLIVPRLLDSKTYMQSIREFQLAEDELGIWYLGQNGFLLRTATSPLIGIDLYLSNSCAETFAHLPFRLDRQLPIFIEPEDLDVDVFITTHSHQDHADPETLRRLRRLSATIFVGPFDSIRIYRECGIEGDRCRLIHPGELLEISEGTSIQATFAFPTDATDLNHAGMLLRFPNGISFLNSGDTAWAPRLSELLPRHIDVCAICINGGFYNLCPTQAAEVVNAIKPRFVVPCHYDMMVNNVGSPDMLRVALELLGAEARFLQLSYYEPWIYSRRDSAPEDLLQKI